MPVFGLSLGVSAAAAIRVASLDLCADEYLLLVARPGEITSVSRLSHDAADSSLWRAARRHHANQGNVESVLGARPTLLLRMGGGGKASGAIARRLGIATLDLPYPNSPAEVGANLRRLAATLGDPARAEPWAKRLAEVERKTPPPRDAIFLSGRGDSLSAGSLGSQWMALAGLRQRALAGGRATLETLALRPPQVLLRSDYRRAQVSLGQRWLAHPLAARARTRMIATDGRRWTCSGPLMLEEVERLQRVR